METMRLHTHAMCSRYTTWAIAVATTAFLTFSAFADSEIKHDFAPGRDKAVPHVSGAEAFTDTYRFWKDEQSIRAAKKMGLMSHEMNFKDFRWLEKSMDGELVLDIGKTYYNTKNKDGKSCASCHGADGEKLMGAYAKMPSYNKRVGRVVVGPTQIRICAEERLGRKDWAENTRPNTLTAFYLASLSDGKVINVDVSKGPMKKSFERGRDLFFKRVGHFHYACSSCHTPPTIGKYLRGQRPTIYHGDASEYPIYHFPYVLPGDNFEYVFTLQHQIKSCQKLSRMYMGREGSSAMTDIEVFLRASSNGYKMSIPVQEYNIDAGYLDRGK